ncbi:MAG: hypothetical protein PSV35_05805 [bacterium]|nr:hypothetical protein [bacterium]
MGRKISIIVLGNNHADFVPYRGLTKIYEQLAQQSIPSAFLEEGPSDQTIADTLASTHRAILQDQTFKRLVPAIINLYTRNEGLPYTYLTRAAHKPLEKIFDQKIIPLLGKAGKKPGFVEQVLLEMYRENAYVEQVDLYKKLIQLKVLFAGIDAPSTKYDEQILASSSSAISYRNNELTRIETMVSNIFITLEKFPKGGVIIVWTGNNHVHRLAANIQHQSSKSSNGSKEIEIQVHAFKLISAFVEDWQEERDLAQELTASLDSKEILEIYQSLPCPIIKLQNYDSLNTSKFNTHMLNVMSEHREPCELSSNRHSIFKSAHPHDQLLKEIKEYAENNASKVKDNLFKSVEEVKNYSLALRIVCSWGNVELVKMLVKFSPKLPIDFHQSSSNGKTPIAWFESSTATDEDKKIIKTLLDEKMRDQHASLSNTTTP